MILGIVEFFCFVFQGFQLYIPDDGELSPKRVKVSLMSCSLESESVPLQLYSFDASQGSAEDSAASTCSVGSPLLEEVCLFLFSVGIV